MIAFIDTLFNPLFDWINTAKDSLLNASVPLSQSLPISTLFNPIAMLSPGWQLLVSNIFILAFIFLNVYVAVNFAGLIEKFRNTVKWW